MPTIPGSGKRPQIRPPKIRSLPDRLHHQAFDNSLQASIIFIVADGRIISVNPAACKLLGYSKKELLTKHRKDIFEISDRPFKKMLRQRKEEGSARANLSLIRKSGKLVPCEISSVLFKDSEGITNSILSIVDLRERLLLQKNIDLKKEKIVADNIVIAQSVSDTRHAQNSDWIRSINKTSYDLIWDWDIPANIISFGNNYDKIFGYKLPGHKIGFNEWIALFLPEEGDMLASKIKSALATEKANWEDSYSFTCADGSAGQVSSRANIIRDNNGNPIRMIGVMRDLSKQQQREEMHEEQIRKKELEIVEAIVEAKEMERSDIGKELHDNINQLLGASMLYLDMARKDLNNGEIYLIHSSEYTLSAIEEIRKLTRGLTNVIIADFGLCGAIEHTCEDIMEVSGVKIHYALDHALEETMSAKFKLNAFRILQEQLNNIVKHAKASTINISLSKAASGFQLSIADDGVGFDSTQKSKGIGISNIVSRTELYKGNAHFISEPGKGCMLAVTFPAA